ncbi:MAG: RNA polymerase subunit sigma-70 [Clostridia bacterium]
MTGKNKFNKINKALINSLEVRGDATPQYLDMIETYMALLHTKNMLIDDIEKHGVSNEYDNGGGQKGVKSNQSVGQLVKVTQQMIKTLEALGFKPNGDGGASEEL